MDDKFFQIMERSIDANKYICDSCNNSLKDIAKSYKGIITRIVIAFVICIIVLSFSFIYTTYKSYDYEGYPETDIVNTNTNTNNVGGE